MAKKDQKTELSKVYSPKEVEEKWLKIWLDGNHYDVDQNADKPPYSMVIPPPNITGTLHLGHALNNTIQDILARYKRLKGYKVLWVPGIDHAGIATQNVVEKQLHAEGTDRHAIGRDKFIERVWKWKEESGGTIVNQIKRLGSSCDFNHMRFTMDEGLSHSVKEVFKTLYDEGLIYRGDYIINWCPRCHTALSDLEVETKEKKGKLYYIKYPLKKDPSRFLTVATTRPETLLGDVAVAVNPEDDRFKDLIGETLMLPLTTKEIPIIADDHVEMDFGTGAVKITPAHDFNDFEIGKRHDLPFIKIMDINALMFTDNVPGADKYSGLDRYKARNMMLEDLEDAGLLSKIDDHQMMLGDCYRCHTVVEPTLSKQWFVKVAPLAGPAIKAVEDGDVRFVPKSWENTYFDWMHNIRDWCISRQIWWGHRIPAWHCGDCSHITVSTGEPTECEKCGSDIINQDNDVLDTWFSSALWPFSTMGWPKETDTLKTFYPTSTLSTSFDIIFFWVARMIMMGLKFKGEVPFKDVYIHALVRDAEGKKMSKSKGNVINPLSVMDDFGTDALRFTMTALAAQGRDIKLSEDRIEGYRNFCNKIWNLARFALMNVEDPNKAKFTEEDLTDSDKWILTRLSECSIRVETSLDKYLFDDAAKALYKFFWNELCDWYVELIKDDLKTDGKRKDTAAAVLVYSLKEGLKLLHPIMPFITDEIYSYLEEDHITLLKAEYPKDLKSYTTEADKIEALMEVIKVIRNIRVEMGVKPGEKIKATCQSDDDKTLAILKDGADYIKTIARVNDLTVRASAAAPKGVAFGLAGLVEVFIPLEGLIDIDTERARLTKELDKVKKEVSRIEGKLSNKSFTDRAPAEVITKEKEKLEGYKDQFRKLEDSLERLK